MVLVLPFVTDFKRFNSSFYAITITYSSINIYLIYNSKTNTGNGVKIFSIRTSIYFIWGPKNLGASIGIHFHSSIPTFIISAASKYPRNVRQLKE
jgi:hypothetical protein